MKTSLYRQTSGIELEAARTARFDQSYFEVGGPGW
jgi:hypothetical protein